jgi:redox-sensitive bicupin YhaK (pirin superfamily)
MKYVAEQDRKFTDMGDVKIYHSVYPMVYPPVDSEWGPVIRFDNKVLLPGKQEVEHFIGSPIQIIRVAINGAADYYDSWGYRTVLNEQDTLAVNTDNGLLSTVLHNTDNCADTELLEIWLLSDDNEKDYKFHSSPANRTKGKFYTMISKDSERDKTQQDKWLRLGAFTEGSTYTIADISEGHTIILFVFNGEVAANGQQLSYRDTAIFHGDNRIVLEFGKSTNLFMMELGKKENTAISTTSMN